MIELAAILSAAVQGFAARGFRSLRVARAEEGGSWRFLGVLPLFDPPRVDSKETIATAAQMGVKVKMVTGDQLAIAKEMASQLGLGQNIVDAAVLADTKHFDAGHLAKVVEGGICHNRRNELKRRRAVFDKRSGWRYYPAAYARNNRVKPGVAVVNGQEVRHKTGYYTLRFCRGPKPVFEALKNASPAEAEAKRKKKEAQLSVVIAAGKADLKIEPADPQRKLLTAQLKQFLADTVDRGPLEAAEVYELACDEFLEVIGRQYVDEIAAEDIIKFQKALAARGMSPRTVSTGTRASKHSSGTVAAIQRNCRSHRSTTRRCLRSIPTRN
jgi:hypothetical protein